jgi:hypothetical protein
MKKTLAHLITNKIKKGEVAMKSQFAIWMEQFGLNGGVVAVVLFLTLTIGFVLYWINSNTDLLFGGYGKYGLFSFFQSFPYLFILIFVVGFIALITLFRRYDFSYKKPFFAILLVVVIGIFVLAWISSKQRIGQQLYNQEGRYLRMGMMNTNNAVSGTVVRMGKSTLVIENQNKKGIVAVYSADTHFPFGQPKVGDLVRVVGAWNGSVFSALGIRVFDDTNPEILGPGMMRRQGGQGRGMMFNR